MAAILDVGYTNPLDIDKQLIELDREDCRDLVNFIRLSWHLVEPGAEYVHSWHIDFLGCSLRGNHKRRRAGRRIALQPPADQHSARHDEELTR